jgi:hypothetical protein
MKRKHKHVTVEYTASFFLGITLCGLHILCMHVYRNSVLHHYSARFFYINEH